MAEQQQSDAHASKSSITDFKTRLSGGGARPNLFYVEFTDLFNDSFLRKMGRLSSLVMICRE